MDTNKKPESTINLVDLFFYLLSYWYLFVAGVVICGGIATYRYAKADFVYQAEASVMIKSPSEQANGARLELYSNLINRTNINNEILEFQSKGLMTQVVHKLHADVSYTTKIRMRMIELYSQSPVMAEFMDDCKDQYVNFSVIPRSDSLFTVEYGKKGKMDVKAGEMVTIGTARFRLYPTPFNTEEYKNKRVVVNKLSEGAAARGYLAKLDIWQSQNNASLLNFRLKDASAMRACSILNLLFEVYNERSVANKRKVSINTAVFIDERLKVIGQELNSVESELQSVQSKHKVMSSKEAASSYQEITKESIEQRNELDNQIRLAGYVKDYIQKSTEPTNLIISSNGVNDAGLQSFINDYNALRIQRDRLITNSSKNSPVIKNMNAQLLGLKDNIINQIDLYVRTLQTKKEDLDKRERDLHFQYASMPSAAREILSVERKQNIKQNLYLYLLNKREENALSQAMVDDNARVIDVAESSGVHIAPDRNKSILLGVIIGLVLPALLLVLRLLLDTKVRTRKEIDETIDVPFLAEIPDMTKKIKEMSGDMNSCLYELCSNRSVFTESMRMLCTNIDFMDEKQDTGKVITVSSFQVNSGKSFLAMNMAACYADNKKKVILLDLDLRKRSTSRYLGLGHGHAGLSNYLSDSELPIDNLIYENVFNGVYFLPAGMIPPNPVELLRRPRLDALIAELKTKFDYIIIDNVPADIVADASIINRVVDTTVFVIRCGSLDRRMLPSIEELYQSGKLTNMGLVLNGTSLDGHYGYRYGYGYAYGYGYGYGYGHGYSYAYADKDNPEEEEA